MFKKLSATSPALKAMLLHLFLLLNTLSRANSVTFLTDDEGTLPSVLPPPEPNAVATPVANNPSLSFFMHDILGGSAPSGRVVAGFIANTQTNNILPFSKPNGGVFPVNGGVPLVTAFNTNKQPFIAGLNGASTTSTVFNNRGNNNNVVTRGNTLPFVTAGQLPQGAATLQKLMFGTITAIDDELTQGHEFGSSVIGKAQGFFLASSLDGNSHTMVFTAMLHGADHEKEEEEEEDTISFFGVHRTAANLSHLAIVGGTGKYVAAGGYATIETLHLTDQHTTDGVDTLLHFTVYLSH